MQGRHAQLPTAGSGKAHTAAMHLAAAAPLPHLPCSFARLSRLLSAASNPMASCGSARCIAGHANLTMLQCKQAPCAAPQCMHATSPSRYCFEPCWAAQPWAWAPPFAPWAWQLQQSVMEGIVRNRDSCITSTAATEECPTATSTQSSSAEAGPHFYGLWAPCQPQVRLQRLVRDWVAPAMPPTAAAHHQNLLREGGSSGMVASHHCRLNRVQVLQVPLGQACLPLDQAVHRAAAHSHRGPTPPHK